MQNEDEVQETRGPTAVGVVIDVDDQEKPSHLRALPFSSSATQKVDAGQEIASMSLKNPVESRVDGADHDTPFQVKARPLLSTLTQNVAA
jgi:hypothetical protein